MNGAYEYAKYFIKKGVDSNPDTFDGNMKLQKMLVFADMIHIAQYGKPLFKDKILALQNGCVVEDIRLRYKADYFGMREDSARFEPDFTDEEYGTLDAAIGIFGHVPARELSELNHGFSSWKQAYMAGTLQDGRQDKDRSEVDPEAYPEDIAAVKMALDAYYRRVKRTPNIEIINGVSFFFDDMEMTDALMSELENFSVSCDDDAYTVCMDDGRLVIY